MLLRRRRRDRAQRDGVRLAQPHPDLEGQLLLQDALLLRDRRQLEQPLLQDDRGQGVLPHLAREVAVGGGDLHAEVGGGGGGIVEGAGRGGVVMVVGGRGARGGDQRVVLARRGGGRRVGGRGGGRRGLLAPREHGGERRAEARLVTARLLAWNNKVNAI